MEFLEATPSCYGFLKKPCGFWAQLPWSGYGWVMGAGCGSVLLLE